MKKEMHVGLSTSNDYKFTNFFLQIYQKSNDLGQRNKHAGCQAKELCEKFLQTEGFLLPLTHEPS